MIFRKRDPQRRAQPGSMRDGGIVKTIADQVAALARDVTGLRLRVEKQDLIASPAAAVGSRVFKPDTTTTFLLDRTASGAAGTKSQYVVRDGVTYTIPLRFPPPGLFEARFLTVLITQRRFDPTEGVEQIRVPVGQAIAVRDPSLLNVGGDQTVKWSYAPNRFINFFWNLVDGKSGRTLSDELLPDMLLLPPIGNINPSNSNPQTIAPFLSDPGDVGLELDTPWLFERDADIQFLFRPVTPIIQPSADSGFLPYNPTDDREQNSTTRLSDVTVQVELHGARLLTDVDAQRAGARVDEERFHKGGFG